MGSQGVRVQTMVSMAEERSFRSATVSIIQGLELMGDCRAKDFIKRAEMCSFSPKLYRTA